MADIKDTLRLDLTTAMKARDTFRTGVLRMALSAIQNEEVSGESARRLSHDEEEALLGKEVRKRRESAEAYDAGHRPELAAKERAEIELLAAYLALGSQPTMRQMGQVIKAVNARAKGRADGATVAAKVKAALAP